MYMSMSDVFSFNSEISKIIEEENKQIKKESR